MPIATLSNWMTSSSLLIEIPLVLAPNGPVHLAFIARGNNSCFCRHRRRAARRDLDLLRVVAIPDRPCPAATDAARAAAHGKGPPDGITLAPGRSGVAWLRRKGKRTGNGVQGTRFFRRAADRQSASRQLSRRPHQVRGATGSL